MQQFQRLKQALNIHEIEQKRQIIHYHNEEIVYSNFASLKMAAFNTNSIIKMTPQYLRPIMIKHLGARALQYFSTIDHKHKSIMINYPIESLLDANFSTQIFYSKVLHFDILTNQVILSLNLNFLPNNQPLNQIINNIDNLKKNNIRIVCEHVNVHNIDFVMKIKPYFVVYDVVKGNHSKKNEYDKLMKRMLKKAKIDYYVK
jgi:hypothetical protein